MSHQVNLQMNNNINSDSDKSIPAVKFRNVYFNYNSSKDEDNFILTGVNLTVPKGGIYGLLGSSGCGKTTLLRCTLGRLIPKRGLIQMFGKIPGSSDCDVPGPGVGYMPQELALYTEFTIEETLLYFGRIFGMKYEAILKRIDFLVTLLQLPGKDSLVHCLSGGQQRRVSLATALFHSPPLLILDEPTVGVDPLLREAIWIHLEALCNAGLTVILTTHYIEEAKSARVVGFMRSGKLLAEGKPSDLMNQFQLLSLESVFLRLCKNEAYHSIESENDKEGKEKVDIKETLDVYHSPKFERKGSIAGANHNYEDEENIICTNIKLEKFDGVLPPVSNIITIIHTDCDAEENENENEDTDENKNVDKGTTCHETNDANGNAIGYTNPAFIKSSLDPALSIPEKERNAISRRQSMGFTIMQVEIPPIIYPSRHQSEVNSYNQFNLTKTSTHMSALVRKNFKQLARNWLLLSFFLVLPAIEISLLVISVGRSPRELPVAVFNQDVGLEKISNKETMLFSDMFLNSLDPKYILLKKYPSFNHTINAVKNNDAWAAIIFQKKFSEAMDLRRRLGPLVDKEIVDASSISLYSDMSNQVIGFQIQRAIIEGFVKFVEKIAHEAEVNPEIMKLPIVIEDPIYGVKKPTLTSFIAPGALIVLAYFATTIITCHLLIKERHDGLVDRSLVSGVAPVEFVLSHIVTQVLMLFIQVTFELIVAFVAFKLPLEGSVFTAISLCFAQGICGLMFGLMVSAACQDEIYATMLGIGTFFPSVIIGGIFWPLESMPLALRYISWTFPSTLAIESLRCILLRGWGFEYFQVTIGFIVTLIWFLIFLFNAIIFFKRKL